MPSRIILDSWKRGKISDETAQADIQKVREPGQMRLLSFFEWRFARLIKEHHADFTQEILYGEQKHCLPFHDHPKIGEWVAQYLDTSAQQFRHKSLLIRGKSRSGKTQKACSIFGFGSSLVVNCQGLGSNLPSLNHLNRREHKCLILDEANYEQVVANKQFFQAGARAVQLGQSACNQFAYSVFVYKLPIILCSNKFPMTEEEGLSEEDADWLGANIIEVPQPVGGKWYVEGQELDLDCA